MRDRWRALPTIALGIGAILVAVVLWQVDPNAPGNGLPPCPFLALTGLYCPGCGSTRALHALLHGDLGHALAMNPLLVLSLPLLALMAINAAGVWTPPGHSRAWHVVSHPKFWLWLLLGYTVARNLPWWPLSWLAPG